MLLNYLHWANNQYLISLVIHITQPSKTSYHSKDIDSAASSPFYERIRTNSPHKLIPSS